MLWSFEVDPTVTFGGISGDLQNTALVFFSV